MEENNDDAVLEYIEQFSQVFNTMANEALTRGLGGDTSSFTPMFDPETYKSLLSGATNIDAAKLLEQQMSFMHQQSELWQSASRALLGEKVEPVIEPERGDHRFKDEEWDDNPVYSYLKQAYLLNSKMLESMVDTLKFANPKTEEKVKFFTRQYLSSVSPSNNILTNPEVCREILETKGQNLVRGMENFLKDLEQSPAEAIKITQTDPNAFTIGKDIAITPGEVIFQNELMQLIQYSPSTKEVYQTPLLIVPAYINKYYILDLNAKKSFAAWLVAQGFTVFMISWVNPDKSLADTDFSDYIEKGIVTALDTVEAITGEDGVNAGGYCVGGTVLATTQAYLKARGDHRIKSVSFYASLMDFSEPGEVGNYLSEQMLALIEKSTESKGLFDGRVLGLSFSMLRENNLFWSYFVNNYLKGKDPAPFDLLYWNSDNTNIPAKAFSYYTRNMYIDNKLVEANALEVNGVPIDLNNIDTPVYILATIADHIVLWQSAYMAVAQPSGSVRFVLAGSGHIAGVINPPATGRYPHWINDALPERAEDWFEGATEVAGSWWPDWVNWLQPQSGDKVPARKPGSEQFPPLQPAPGDYVKVRI